MNISKKNCAELEKKRKNMWMQKINIYSVCITHKIAVHNIIQLHFFYFKILYAKWKHQSIYQLNKIRFSEKFSYYCRIKYPKTTLMNVKKAIKRTVLFCT